MDITDAIDVSFFFSWPTGLMSQLQDYHAKQAGSKRHNITRIRFRIRIVGRSAVLKSVPSPLNNIMQVKR